MAPKTSNSAINLNTKSETDVMKKVEHLIKKELEKFPEWSLLYQVMGAWHYFKEEEEKAIEWWEKATILMLKNPPESKMPRPEKYRKLGLGNFSDVWEESLGVCKYFKLENLVGIDQIQFEISERLPKFLNFQ